MPYCIIYTIWHKNLTIFSQGQETVKLVTSYFKISKDITIVLENNILFQWRVQEKAGLSHGKKESYPFVGPLIPLF